MFLFTTFCYGWKGVSSTALNSLMIGFALRFQSLEKIISYVHCVWHWKDTSTLRNAVIALVGAVLALKVQ